ncbi:hypothetical protein FACS189499_07800 [Clostridia bacterium]|nr:hypothetical protein FACS189499_07800 [Clostridia bacterium]
MLDDYTNGNTDVGLIENKDKNDDKIDDNGSTKTDNPDTDAGSPFVGILALWSGAIAVGAGLLKRKKK